MNRKIDISIVIPAYNEKKRLPRFLSQVISYCKKQTEGYEIIVVDDGSKDETFKIANSYKEQFADLYVVRNKKNRGKGYAVKRGLFRAKGEICLFLDADGSVGPEEIHKNLHYILDEKYDIFVGSRVVKNKAQIRKTRWHRKLIGAVFNFCVQTFLFKDIKDTQCGFKIFRKVIVKPLFSRSHLRGFGFDIEILYLAHKMGYKVKEGPVSWRHVTGSKVNLLIDPVKMFINIFQVRNWHYRL